MVATGAKTAIGRINGMLPEVSTLQTPLTRQMGVFAQWRTGSILVLAVLAFAFGLLLGDYNVAEESQRKAEEISERVGDWAYQISDYAANRLRRPLDELLEDPSGTS